MYSISKKINITKKASVTKSTFLNDEALPAAITTFTCCNCGHENTVEIIPYESGFPIFQVYNEDKVVSKDELLKHGIVNGTSQRMLHFGELTVNDLPTLYFGTDCSSCHSKYICVFSYGEKQPGLMILSISGIWKYEELK
ncbi:hypothetical protein [Chryseobacterium viscerum]|uniref:hypothetical protein n=1 Tax=Chryseobacterium TaxID=59732 RepID=UPI000645E72A|nr:hypothetical protein [Chryseobacterium viscerum]MCW1962178.1 hypothetical protein [Chryseobacterium viscerum]WPO93336.1 hypothetical protein SFA27_11630 [Chryseobacterium sp. HR92]